MSNFENDVYETNSATVDTMKQGVYIGILLFIAFYVIPTGVVFMTMRIASFFEMSFLVGSLLFIGTALIVGLLSFLFLKITNKYVNLHIYSYGVFAPLFLVGHMIALFMILQNLKQKHLFETHKTLVKMSVIPLLFLSGLVILFLSICGQYLF